MSGKKGPPPERQRSAHKASDAAGLGAGRQGGGAA